MSNRLPVIVARRDATCAIELDLFLQPGLLWFDGHFEGFPVLPGVVQLHWANHFASAYFSLPQQPALNYQVKFRRVLLAEQNPTLRLLHEPEKNRVQFMFFDRETVYSSGSIKIAVHEATV